MAIVSRAEATWSGTLAEGDGQVSAASSGAFTALPITWSARTEDHGGLTSPEELLASAHAACFAMAFASNLTKAGTPPTRLDVSADITFEKLDAGWTVISSALTVRGTAPGVAEADFAFDRRGTTKDGCPISRAVQGNVALSVDRDPRGLTAASVDGEEPSRVGDRHRPDLVVADARRAEPRAGTSRPGRRSRGRRTG